MTAACWRQLNASALCDKLLLVGESLREVVPVYVEKQGEALKRLAETAILAHGGQLPQEEEEHEQ